MEVVHKTVDILESFLRQPGEIGLAELAEFSGINISSAHRIASDLVQRGYLRQRQKRGKYSIGLKMLEFTGIIQRNLKIGDLSQAHLQKLSEMSDESVNMAILDSGEALNIAQVEVDKSLRISAWVGERLPLHTSSVGKVLLAFMKPVDQELFFQQPKLKPRTARTITDCEALFNEIQEIRRQGFSIDNEEHDLGVWSVAAPIYDVNSNVVASAAIVAPTVRIVDGKSDKLISLVKQNAQDISRELGWNET